VRPPAIRTTNIVLLALVAGLAAAAYLVLSATPTAATAVPRTSAVARTDDRRADELGRLARAFNTMLAALADSIAAQRQLVADASHELRTPLTTPVRASSPCSSTRRCGRVNNARASTRPWWSSPR
jgi:signal transduction histidine kinase